MNSTLFSLTGQWPHVHGVYYDFLGYNAYLLKRSLGFVKYHSLHNEPNKGVAKGIELPSQQRQRWGVFV